MARHSFFCIDGHTCGNPVRLVAGGGPRLQGSTMMERRAHFLAEYDWIRTGLMFEPRGHDMMSGGFLYPPTREDADIGVLFIETSGCLPMCGHGTIGIMTFGLENGLIKPRTPGRLRVEVPAGVIERYRGRIVNVHPALLPAFGGRGMYGRRVHEAVLASGARESGASVHLVDEVYDRGEVLARARVPVLPDDDPDRLAARVTSISR